MYGKLPTEGRQDSQSGLAKPSQATTQRDPSHCHLCGHPLPLHLILRSKSVTQTSWLDFLSWSISLPSSRLLTLQNETPSLEIRSEVRESRPQGMLAEFAVWGTGTESVWTCSWCERRALPHVSSGEGPGPPTGINCSAPSSLWSS